MLRELHISNLAVIADARLELAAGLNCFTGATGAGKSLVIGALELLLGLRSPADMLRTGSAEARVIGLFEIADLLQAGQIGRLADLSDDELGAELLITRRLLPGARSSISLNGRPITLAMLKQVAERLIDVHGQHDHQFLLKAPNQLDVLDQFAGLDGVRREYAQVFGEWSAGVRAIADLQQNQELRRQQLELYQFQADEIDEARIDPAEYREIQARATVLTHMQKLQKEAGAARSSLYEAEGSVVERLRAIGGILSELSELDAGLAPIAKAIRESTVNLEEAAFDLNRYLDRLEMDPAELAEINERLNTIHRLVRKYADSPEGVLEFRRALEGKLIELKAGGESVEELKRKLPEFRARAVELAKDLSQRRHSAAIRLAKQVSSSLAELGMPHAGFAAEFAGDKVTEDSQLTATGSDSMEFVVRTNPGNPMLPLRKIASGGELSRIMLGLKGILAQKDRVSVLVFDEIDSNVGGRLGAVIGEKLRALARHHQVLCITHLPQIACYADAHFTVRKTVKGERAQSTVRRMEGAERIEELAEMIAGEKVTETARAQARELLSAATEHAPIKKETAIRGGRGPDRGSVSKKIRPVTKHSKS